jgi:hypothetical protein
MSLPNSSVHRCAPKGVHVHPEQVVAKGLSGCRLWVDQPAIELVKKSPRIPGQAFPDKRVKKSQKGCNCSARSSPRTRGPRLCLNHGPWIWQRLDSRVRGNERGSRVRSFSARARGNERTGIVAAFLISSNTPSRKRATRAVRLIRGSAYPLSATRNNSTRALRAPCHATRPWQRDRGTRQRKTGAGGRSASARRPLTALPRQRWSQWPYWSHWWSPPRCSPPRWWPQRCSAPQRRSRLRRS